MKTSQTQPSAPYRIILAMCITAGIASAQTSSTSQINWGSLDESIIVDSTGAVLTPDNFTFDLGAFNAGFTPTESNVADWGANWITFDRATYNQAGGVFASEYTAYNDNFPDNSSFPSQNGFDFEALGISRDAFIWVYNNFDAVPGTEWFLARASSWVFPTLADELDNTLPIEWSMSDLGTAQPLWGNQLGFEGSGVFTEFVGNANLQTYTFIPEPSTALLIALAGLAGVLRRSRRGA